MLLLLLRALSRLPLRSLHSLGTALGWIVYWLSPSYARRLNANIRQSGLYADAAGYRRLRRAAIGEAGKTAMELIAIWFKPEPQLMAMVREVVNFEAVEAARAAGRGILILTPHLGCFEMVGFYFGQRMPFTVLYRPPRLGWLGPLMIRGRRRGHVALATTDIAGVRRLLKALRAGSAAGMLPDQAPRFGEGVWARFFGRPAFTMTLSNRLRRATGCATFMVFAQRLSRGEGYRLHIDALPDEVGDELQLNRAVEAIIATHPAQYLWGYDRYKIPRGVTAPAVRAHQAPPQEQERT